MAIIFIVIIGFSGLVAQLLLLRELLVSFLGNELVIGVILSNWVLAEAIGAYLLGRVIERVGRKERVVFFLQIVFSLSLPAAVYLSRIGCNLLGLRFGEAPGLWPIIALSFIIIFPVGFSHGGLFSCLCKILADSAKKDKASMIGQAYAWETVGTMIGGVVFTYLLLPFLNAFQITSVITLLNLFLCLMIQSPFGYPIKRVSLIGAAAVVACALLLNDGNYLQQRSAQLQHKNAQLLDYRASVHGTIAVTKDKEQFTFFYNGLPIITSPNPDTEFVEEFSHIPLLFHDAPKEILVIGGGAGGLLAEILKYPLARLDYIELDPMIIKLIQSNPTDLTRSELEDRRVCLINQDGRYFLKNTKKKYDVIFIGFPSPSELSLNRFFTTEFFALANGRLNDGGLITFCLPGSLSYLGNELKGINGSIMLSLRKTYRYVRVIPGDRTIYMASPSDIFFSKKAEELTRRQAERNIQTKLVSLSQLKYRLDKKWETWFNQAIKNSTSQENSDLSPSAVYSTMRLWDKQFSTQAGRRQAFLFLGLLFFLILWVFMAKKPPERLLAYVLATTGFFGMFMVLILVVCFQVFYGYLYQNIGLLISFFMAGSALGGLAVFRLKSAALKTINVLITVEVSTIVFVLVIVGCIVMVGSRWSAVSFLFYLFSFFAGLLVGLEFVSASDLSMSRGGGAGETSGFLYAADLFGSYAAGITGTVFLLPLWGVWGCAFLLCVLKASSLFMLLSFGQKRRFFL